MLLRANQVARIYGDQTIFSDVNLEIGAGERLALVGENGSGKSTLLRLLAGLDSPDAGTLTRAGQVALLTQQAGAGPSGVLDAVTPPELRLAQAEFERASAALGADSSAEVLSAFADAEETYRILSGYDFGGRARAVLTGLGVDAEAQADTLSGGQLRRVMLARLLLSPAEVYLLDEPTNHLDVGGAEWLESWIGASAAAFVFASHDRAFLDAVATRTAELERGTLTLYPGGYSAAMRLKATLREAQERDHEAYRRKKAALDEERQRQASKTRSAGVFNSKRAHDNDKFITRSKAQNVQTTSANAARNLRKQIERLDARAAAKPYDDHRSVRLDLPPAPVGPAEVLTVKGLTVWRGEKEILKGADLYVRRGERIALTGPNGGGKSTLLGVLLGQLPYQGEVNWGAGLTRYVAGQHGEELLGLHTVGDALLDANPALTPHQLHEVAAQVQLPGPAFALAGLSGGQRTRLSLARLGVTRAQVLVLDEPTNHLDIRMIEVLEGVLADFPGTVLLASHDRTLIERLTTRIWEVGGGRVQEIGK